MATWDDVRRTATALPEVTETTGGHDHLPDWRVRGKPFAWERPLRRRDVDELGAAAPTGPVLGIRVADLLSKQELLVAEPACFATTHFDGYAAVLVRLEDVAPDLLVELLTDAWLARAPKRLAAAWWAEPR